MSAIEAIPTALIRTVLSFGENEEAWNLAGVSRGLRDSVESVSRDCLEKIRADHRPDGQFDGRVDRSAEEARVEASARGSVGKTVGGVRSRFLDSSVLANLTLLTAAMAVFLDLPLPQITRPLLVALCIMRIMHLMYCYFFLPTPPLPWRLKLRCAAVVPLEAVEPFKSERVAICCLPGGKHLAVLGITGDLHVFEISTWKCVESITPGFPPSVYVVFKLCCSAGHVVLWGEYFLRIWQWDPDKGLLHHKYDWNSLYNDPARHISGEVVAVASDGFMYVAKHLPDDCFSIEAINVVSGERSRPIPHFPESKYHHLANSFMACGGFLLGHASEGIEVIDRSDLSRTKQFFRGRFTSLLHGSPNGHLIVSQHSTFSKSGDLWIGCLMEGHIFHRGTICSEPKNNYEGLFPSVSLVSDREVFSRSRGDKFDLLTPTTILVHDAITGQVLRKIVHPVVTDQTFKSALAVVAENQQEIIVSYGFGASCAFKPIHRYVATPRSYTA